MKKGSFGGTFTKEHGAVTLLDKFERVLNRPVTRRVGMWSMLIGIALFVNVLTSELVGRTTGSQSLGYALGWTVCLAVILVVIVWAINRKMSREDEAGSLAEGERPWEY